MLTAGYSVLSQVDDWSSGAAWVDGKFVPAGQAMVSVFDWGFTRSDVTYDVVHVWRGQFFRLAEHISRFRRSVAGLRMELRLSDIELSEILHGCVRRSGLRDAYVAMILTRGEPNPKWPKRLPSVFKGSNKLVCYAIPFIWIMKPEIQEIGADMIIAKTPRISPESVNPTYKNYHWGDFTNALFEVEDADADYAVLMGVDGYIAECPGANVFAVFDGVVTSPERGALEGVTRRSIHELCDLLGLENAHRNITAMEFRKADEIFMASTAGGIMPIRKLDNQLLSNGRVGPISRQLHAEYWKKHEEGWHGTSVDYDLD